MNAEKKVAMNKATKRVLDLFESTGMAIDPFEKAVGLTEGTIKNLKNYKYNVSADTICKVAEYFEVTTDYVMGYTDFPKSPTSWYVFRRMVLRLNKSWDTVTKELNKPLSFFVDWEHGKEPTQLELWSICNTWQLKTNPFEKIKKAVPMERPQYGLAISNYKENCENLASDEKFVNTTQIYAHLEMAVRSALYGELVKWLENRGIDVAGILGL